MAAASSGAELLAHSLSPPLPVQPFSISASIYAGISSANGTAAYPGPELNPLSGALSRHAVDGSTVSAFVAELCVLCLFFFREKFFFDCLQPDALIVSRSCLCIQLRTKSSLSGQTSSSLLFRIFQFLLDSLDRSLGFHRWRPSAPEFNPPFVLESEIPPAVPRTLGINFAVSYCLPRLFLFP